MRQRLGAEELNPWTFRHRSTLDSFHDPHNDSHGETLRLNDSKLTGINVFPRRPSHGQRTRAMLREPLQRFQRLRMPVLSIEESAFEHMQQTLACALDGPFKPLRCKSNETRNCFIAVPQRRSTLPAEPTTKKKLGSPQRVLKFKRFYTEEREEKLEEASERERQTETLAELLSVNPLSPVSNRPNFPVKLVRSGNGRPQVAARGKLLESVIALCQQKGVGHLSQMKRTYNLKKLQRLTRSPNDKP